MVSKRYAKANNNKSQNYNEDIEKTWLLYLDANNLYGWAMMQALPTDGFRWYNHNLDKLADDIKKGIITDDSSKGYILEVDLGYCNGFSSVPSPRSLIYCTPLFTFLAPH